MILLWWLPGIGLWVNAGIVAAGLFLTLLTIALLTDPPQMVKRPVYRYDMYGRAHKSGEYETREFGDRGWSTTFAFVGWLMYWPGFVVLAALWLSIGGTIVFTKLLFRVTDKAKAAPQRRKELRKKAEQEANQWWITHLDELDSAWKELQKNETV